MIPLILTAATICTLMLAIFLPSKLIACMAARITKFLTDERS